MIFQSVLTYQAPETDTVIFAAAAQPAKGPWVGAFIDCGKGSAFTAVTLERLLQLIDQPNVVRHVGFLFLGRTPGADSLEAFHTSVLAATTAFPPGPHGGTLGGLVLWLPQFGAFDSNASMLAFPSQATGAVYSYRLGTQLHRLFSVAGAGRFVFLDARATGGATLLLPGTSGAAAALILKHGDRLAISVGDAQPQQAVALSTLTIPLEGDTAGCLSFTGPAAAGVTGFELGFQQAVERVPGKRGAPSRLWFSLLDGDETLAGAQLSVVLDPMSATDPVRNEIVVTPAGGRFTSAYRTVWNEKVALAPDAHACFVGAAASSSCRYFVPSGSFKMTVPSAPGADHRLACGLVGVEDNGFRDGDLLCFVPQPGVRMAPTVGGSRFTPMSDGAVGTAWATLVKAPGNDAPSFYRSESARAPLFSPTSAGQPNLLRHDGFTMGTLPAATAAFPLLPYAAATAVDGVDPGATAELMAALEYGYVAPSRGAILEPIVTPDVGDSRTVAVTPQGYVVSFDGKGGITAVELGSTTDCRLKLAEPTGAPLPQGLRNAFLASQQFIVVSCRTDTVAKYLTAELAMSGWTFTPTQPDAAHIAPGDYTSVLIIKSAGASIADLAAAPSAWTAYGLFNDTATDPDGIILSSWLTTYIANALALYDDGKGLAELQTFCSLVTDPDWDGFLFLRVPVGISNLDPSLGFLRAGVDPSGIVAHHVGCAVNHTKPTGNGSFTLDSSYFGLIHYVRPGTPPNAASVQPFVSASGYDFQLMTLEALFENSALRRFSSSALLVMTQLFGETVLPSATGPGPSATDAVVIFGALQHHDGAPSYTFATAPHASSMFYLSSSALERVEIDRVTVNVDTDAKDERAAVTFQMSGWLGTLAPKDDFDVLSYAAISFSNLALRMEYDADTGANKTFIIDPSGLTVSPLVDQQLSGTAVTADAAAANTLYRSGSLAASFPLKLDRFVIGAKGKAPTDLGYRVLTTGISTNAAALGDEWYGLAFNLPLGTGGSLDASSLLTANLLFAWNAGGAGTPAFSPFIKLSGPGGVNLTFELEGILKFGADGIFLTRRAGSNTFVLEFASVGITIFGRSFPPKGSTNVMLAGFADRSLGWFGAYVDPNVPQMVPPATGR